MCGARWPRSCPIPEGSGKLLVRGEDTLLGRYVEVPADLVVLLTAVVPAEGSQGVGQALWRVGGQGRLFRRGASQAQAGGHDHGRRLSGWLLPEPQGHPRHGGPGQRSRRQGHGPAEPGRDRHRPHRRRGGSRQSAPAAANASWPAPTTPSSGWRARPRSTWPCARAVAPASAPAWPRPSPAITLPTRS